jgi:hypothetical protein
MTLDSERIHEWYNFVEFPLYNPDSAEKWRLMDGLLKRTDYISLSSNRLWGSLTRVPDKFPDTARYYRLLLDGSLGFDKVAEITSFPSLPIPFNDNLCLYINDNAESYLGLPSDKEGFLRLDSCDLYQNTHYNGLVVRDEAAEETFTVYDHPKVMIFKKNRSVDYFNLIYQNPLQN